MTDAPNDTAMHPEGLDAAGEWAKSIIGGPVESWKRPIAQDLSLPFELLAEIGALIRERNEAARRIPALESEKVEAERERDELRAAEPRTLEDTKKEITVICARIQKERDHLRDLIRFVEEMEEDCSSAIRDLESAADFLSELL